MLSNSPSRHLIRRLPTATNSALLTNLNIVKPFMPHAEMLSVRYGLTGEEYAFFIDKLAELADTIRTMPKSYETEDMGDEAVVHLHYFNSASDWYVTELDGMGDGRIQAFGFALLHGDVGNTGMAYINIETLVLHGVELDLHWAKRSLDLVKEAVEA